LEHLVTGNRGRLLDARRTPVRVTAVTPERGEFEVELEAFEDAGARWRLQLSEVRKFQFERDAVTTSAACVAELHRSLEQFERPLRIESHAQARRQTLAEIATARRAIRERISTLQLPDTVCLRDHIERRTGNPELYRLLEEFLDERGVLEHDRSFTQAFVSNPRSGEVVKGHAIVLAELGLCRYEGTVARDPQLFADHWSRARRAEHIIARLSFTQELWSRWSAKPLPLYRGAAFEQVLPDPAPKSFVSATFSRAVAAEHFEGSARARSAILLRQELPLSRLLMTFLETAGLNDRFHEAEAILIGDPENRAF
jgi:hypothetical protein